MLEDNLKELTTAINRLAEALETGEKIPAMGASPADVAGDGEVKKTPAKKKTVKKKVAPKKEAEKVEAPTEVTIDEVRERLRAVLTKDGPEKAKEILNDHGATSVTTLDPEAFAAVLADLDKVLEG
jgi:hypothetical protein